MIPLTTVFLFLAAMSLRSLRRILDRRRGTEMVSLRLADALRGRGAPHRVPLFQRRNPSVTPVIYLAPRLRA